MQRILQEDNNSKGITYTTHILKFKHWNISFPYACKAFFFLLFSIGFISNMENYISDWCLFCLIHVVHKKVCFT